MLKMCVSFFRNKKNQCNGCFLVGWTVFRSTEPFLPIDGPCPSLALFTFSQCAQLSNTGNTHQENQDEGFAVAGKKK